MATWILGPVGGDCCACQPNVCDPCCVCAAPDLLCDSASASLTKCGFEEFGTPSSPPKIYANKTQSGGLDFEFGGVNYTNLWSGSEVIDKPNCTVLSDTRNLQVGVTVITPPYSCLTNIAEAPDDVGAPGPPISYAGCGRWAPHFPCDTGADPVDYCCDDGTNVSSTVKTYAEPGCGSPASTGSTVTLTLSDEYTTVQLIANTEAAFPNYPNTFDGNCAAFVDLSTDEMTYTIQRFQYKFTLPNLASCPNYRIDWEEAGAAKNYVWNHSDTETPIYGPVVGTNSTPVGITNITYACI